MATEYDGLPEHCDNNFEEYNSDADIKLDFIVQTGGFLDSKAETPFISDDIVAQGVLLESIKVEHLDEQLSKDVGSTENCENYNSDADVKLEDCIVQTGDSLDSKVETPLISDDIVAQGVLLENIKVEHLDEQLSNDVGSTENCVNYNSDADVKLEDCIVQTGDSLDSKVETPLISDDIVAQGVLLENKVENLNDECDKSYKYNHYIKTVADCAYCGKSFKGRMKLYQHFRSVHLIKKIQNVHTCSYCGQTFRNNSQLTNHIRMHTGEKPFTCKICKKSFRWRSVLKSHISKHTDERPFTCELCEKSFSRKNALMCHIKIHTGEKPFTCEVCKISFGSVAQLKRHMLVHSGNCHYSCELCSAKFKSSQNLTRHIKLHIKNEV